MTLTLDQVILHTVMHRSSTPTYIANLIEIEETATVEWSFSTMNRIMNSKRSRLLPRHTSQLVKLSIEGLCISDVRDGDGDDTQISAVNELTDSAFSIWSRKPRRGVQ